MPDQFSRHPSTWPSTWQAEVEALRRRINDLEDALRTILGYAKIGNSTYDAVYIALAEEALKTEKDKNDAN